MTFKVCYSDPSTTTSKGFGKVARLPFILDSRPGYHRQASRYLIDRGLGAWDPVARGRGPRASRPSRISIRNYAHWLAHFLEWAEHRGVDIRTCEYGEHILGRYQADMLDGAWSASGEGLAPSTVGLRVQQACDFLTWLSDKDEREAFDVPTTSVKLTLGAATSSVGHRSFEVSKRAGKVRQNKRRLSMPRDADLARWLTDVYTQRGYTLGLACETILLTGLRLEEAACLRFDTLPLERQAWRVANADAPFSEQQVLVQIRFGAKGPDHGESFADKIGPERNILVPMPLAEKWHDYRNRRRNDALKRWTAAADTSAERRARIASTVHLFLREDTGARMTGDHIYRAWKAGALPYPSWSPHLGRDWWACATLRREIKRHDRLLEVGSAAAAAQLLESVGMTVIRLRIQPQLGHRHESTCLIYLQWLIDQFGSGLAIDYDAAFECAPDGGAS